MAFSVKQVGTLEYLISDFLSVPHGFTTRRGGVSSGALASLNLGVHRGDRPENVLENYEILGRALGFSLNRLVLTHQTHTDVVLPVGLAECEREPLQPMEPECDALISNTPGVTLVVFTADCTPILLWDPETGAVGAAHAGWRGTAAGIGAKTVAAMVENFGCSPSNLRAAIGPNIGMCCFETGADVPKAMEAALGAAAVPFIRRQGEKFHVDLKGLNKLWLEQAGVQCIDVSTDCTACQPDRFWSHRVTGDRRGSQAGVISCRGESK